MADEMDEREGTGKRKNELGQSEVIVEEEEEEQDEEDMATALEETGTDPEADYNAHDEASSSGDSGETDADARLVTPGRTEGGNSGDEYHDSQEEEVSARPSLITTGQQLYYNIVGNFMQTRQPVPNEWGREFTDEEVARLAANMESNVNANEATYAHAQATKESTTHTKEPETKVTGTKTSGEVEEDYSFLGTHDDSEMNDDGTEPEKTPAYTVDPNDYFNQPRTKPTGREWNQPFVSLTLQNAAYFDIQVILDDPKKARKDAHEILFSRIKAFLAKYFEQFPEAEFHPFLEEDRELSNDKLTADDYATVLGNSLVKIKKFFYKAIPYYYGGTQYLRYLAAQKDDWVIIEAELFAWWKANGFKVYKKSCQIEDSVIVGWAFRSHGTIDKDVLAAEISRWCRFPVGLRWRFIDVEEGEGSVKALHFEVDAVHAPEDRLHLAGLFHARKTKGWPFQVKLRFVPILAHSGNDTAAEAILSLYTKQYAWCEYLKHWPTRDFQSIDKPKEELYGMTLREYIMAIQSKTRPGIPLFTGINRHYEKRTQWMITAVPQVRSEAYRTLHGLLTYMRHFEKPDPPSRFDTLFEPVVKHRAIGTAWDETKHGILSYETVQIANINGKVDADMEDILKLAAQQQQSKKPARAVPQKRGATDISIDMEDSVDSISMAEIRAPAPGTPGFRAALAAQPPGTRIVAYNETQQDFVFQRPGAASAAPPNTRARYGDGQASRPARHPPGSRPPGGGRARGGGRDERR
jgi:hypothetical protein